MTKHKKTGSFIPPLSIIYRRVAISFVVLTVLLVGIIVFFSLAKATAAVVPKDELKSAEFLVNAKPAPTEGALSTGTINGVYVEKVVQEEGTFEASGTNEKQGRAEGKITVTNTTTAAQPLVATTRFLSKEGILFRTKDRVVVPAKGSIDVAVGADQTGPSGDIGPTHFTIPGLNEAKQKLILGESKAAMAGGAHNVRVVTSQDIEKARTEVAEKAVAHAREEFAKTPAASLGAITVDPEVLSITVNAKKGDERQTFSATANVKVKVLAYDADALQKLALEKVSANIPSDRELVQFHKDAMVIRIKNVNATTGEVQLSVYADAQVRLSAASAILDPVKIAGMLPEEASRYLESFDAVDHVDITLFPSWQKRIPTIPDRIKMVIKK